MDKKVRHFLAQRGYESLRGLLSGMSDGYSGTGRNTTIKLDSEISITRADIEDYLNKEESKRIKREKITLWAAIAGAVFGFIALPFDAFDE
jgi:hypothetical protein